MSAKSDLDSEFAEFEQLCSAHDWHYGRSDDPRVFQRGWEHHAKIKAMRTLLKITDSMRTDRIFYRFNPLTDNYGRQLNQQSGELLDSEDFRVLELQCRRLGPPLTIANEPRIASQLHLIEAQISRIRARHHERDRAQKLKDGKRKGIGAEDR